MRKQLGLPPTKPDDATIVDWVQNEPAKLKHKRIVPRVITIDSSPIPVFNTDYCDCLDIVDLVEPITSMTDGMTGTPVNFQKLMVRIYSASLFEIVWGDAFFDSGVAHLPLITQPGKTIQVGLEYNIAKLGWVTLASDIVGY